MGEEDSVLVKKKKERANFEAPRMAPDLRCLGYSQPELDLHAEHDEADQAAVPEPLSSPRGSALTAIKRDRVYKPVALAPQLCTMLEQRVTNGPNQAELDALCVDADEDDDDENANPNSPGSPGSRTKKDELDSE